MKNNASKLIPHDPPVVDGRAIRDPRVPLLDRLRTETRAEHLAIERTLRLTAADLTRDCYRWRLEQLYGFYRPLETRIQQVCNWSDHGVDLDARRKTPLLAADLRSFGAVPTGLPVCNDLPVLAGVPEGFGCWYVVEGATLGGQIIAGHLRRTLGPAPVRFFHGYGERTGVMWRELRAALTAFAGPRDPIVHDRTVASALATFRTLRAWCDRGADR